MSKYFTDEQIFKLAKKAGFEEAKTFDRFFDKAEMSQLRALMNLAVSTAIGEVAGFRITHIDGSYELSTSETWQKVSKQDKLYTIKELPNG